MSVDRDRESLVLNSGLTDPAVALAILAARAEWEALAHSSAEADAAMRAERNGPRHRAAEAANVEAARRATTALMEAYSTVPKTLPGALALVDLFKATDDGMDSEAGALINTLATFIRSLAQPETARAAV